MEKYFFKWGVNRDGRLKENVPFVGQCASKLTFN